AGPLIGGLFTTYWSWRYVFVGEVLIAAVILIVVRRTADVPPEHAKLDLVGTLLSATGLILMVYGILRAGSWGFGKPQACPPTLFGFARFIWLVVGGGLVILVFFAWERRRLARGEAALVAPAMLRIRQLRGGLTAFFFQFLLQAGLFFTIPLYLSVALGLSAI